ncbi:hypothetical protein [Agrococcus sp. DT81.2]|uniref:hypothetical protein n=1 Tax=Agrococcus sp. DT81.2 TaxID=3393414 RepID=UPI003CE5B334
MTTTSRSTHRASAPWTAIVGLALLWAALLGVGYFAALLTLWELATLDGSGAAGPTLATGFVSLLPLVLMLVVLVFASLRRGWARWGAVAFGLAAGALGLVVLFATGSPALETLALAGAAVAGAVLLALPTSGRWYVGRPPRPE